MKAIRATHGAIATFVEPVAVWEKFEGQTVWESEVLVFDLQDYPTAPKCYAWSVDGRVTAVLHEGPVDSPKAAVRAAIVATTLPALRHTRSSQRPRLSALRVYPTKLGPAWRTMGLAQVG